MAIQFRSEAISPPRYVSSSSPTITALRSTSSSVT